ncbi:MAG: hypothetical protein WCC57_17445 [Paracoccaceae bacterium]
MKVLNNTTGTIHYDTSFTTGDGKSGGDCGDLAPNSPPLNYPIGAGLSNVSISLSVQGVTYADMTDDMFLTVTSSILTESKK